MNHKILVVDDDRNFIQLLKEAFCKEPYRILSAPSALEALEMLAVEPVDVVVSDEVMPAMTGCEFLSLVRKSYPDTVRIILTGYASLETAIRAINEGEIYRFFTKPCNIYDLAITIRQALQHRDVMKENQKLIRMVKRQCDLIERLEKDYPGITAVRRGTEGEILLNEEVLDIQPLLEECRESVRPKS